MTRSTRKWIALVLCLMMCAAALPVAVLAYDASGSAAAVSNAAPVITDQPSNRQTYAGTTITLSVKARGSGLKYQWYYRINSTERWTAVAASSGKTAAYTFTAENRHDGYQYRCRVKNASGSVYTRTVTLTVLDFRITDQPADKTVRPGDSVTFAVKAKGSGLKYQWYYRTSSSGSWTAVVASGGKTASYTLTAGTRHNGYQYRCRVSDASGSVYSDTVTLKVLTFEITGQPSDQSVNAGEEATFRVKATGKSLTYQWYYLAPGSDTWTAVRNNGQTASYTLTAKARHNGYQYRCRVGNSSGSVYTKAVKLKVCTVMITGQPSDQTVKQGDPATFRVKASGEGLVYKWYYMMPGTDVWHPVHYNGTSAVYTLTTRARHNGYLYRCKVTNATGSVYTDVVKLTVKAREEITILTQPTGQNVLEGEEATFRVKASGHGDALTYKWYYQIPGTDKWHPVHNNGTSAVYTLTTKVRHNGYRYRCLIRSDYDSAYTDVVTLTVREKDRITILTQPADQVVTEDGLATFRVEAAGGELTYQWYYRKSPAMSWKPVSSADGNTAVHSFTALLKYDGWQFRCRVRNEYFSKYTDAATLTVTEKERITILTQPVDKTVEDHAEVTFRVEAAGGELTYQWYSRASGEESWTALSGAKEAAYTLTAALSDDGRQFRCLVSSEFDQAYTDAATLTVTAVTTYRALLIGEEGFTPVCTRNWGDVVSMTNMLSHVVGPEGGEFEITTVKDPDSSGIQAAIQSAFAGADEDDVSLFFIATHGDVSRPADSYYAGALNTVGPNGSEGELPLPLLAQWLSAVPGKVIVFIESCGSGAAIYPNAKGETEPVDLFDPALFCQQVVDAFAAVNTTTSTKGPVPNTGDFMTSKFYVLTAAAFQELSYGWEGTSSTSPNNVFTYILVNGVYRSNGSMPADTNKDNMVNLHELYLYIQKNEGRIADQHVQAYPANSTYNLFKKA